MSDIKDFVIEDGVLKKYTGNGGDVMIPEGVTRIDGVRELWFKVGVFSGCSTLTSVVIPEGVESIKDSAFEGCTGLTSVTISESVTEIGNNAFKDCSSLKIVYYTGSLESWVTMDKGKWSDTPLRNGAVLYCNGELVQDVVIPEGVTYIGRNAFSGCGDLTSVAIPKGVKGIGNNAFFGCSALTSVAIPEGVTSIGDSAFSGCYGLTSVVIPESVRSIGEWAFSSCSGLTSLVIPENVTRIGGYAFSRCSGLTCVTIPKSVPNITEHAFHDCSSLKSVTIQDGVKSIWECSFSGCISLTDVVIPESVKSIGHNAFDGCQSLKSVMCPKGITSIGPAVFANCQELKLVVFKYAFSGDALKKLFEINPSLQGKAVFPGLLCSDVPVSVRKATAVRTADAIIQGLEMPENIYKSYLKYIVAHKEEWFVDPSEKNGPAIRLLMKEKQIKITEIDDLIDRVSKLKAPELLNQLMAYQTENFKAEDYDQQTEKEFRQMEKDAELRSDTTSQKYINKMWTAGRKEPLVKSFKDAGKTVVFPKRVGSTDVMGIADGFEFRGEDNARDLVEEVIIPESYTYIGAEAFLGCSNLIRITLPGSITEIAQSAFCGCKSLTSMTIPDSVTEIEKEAFAKCTGLTSVTIPESVTKIGRWAFKGCTNLTSVVIPGSVMEIDLGAFEGCTSLTSVTIPKSVGMIGGCAFKGCSGLTNIIIPFGVRDISFSAFEGCKKIRTLDLPITVNSVGEHAFAQSGIKALVIRNPRLNLKDSNCLKGCRNYTIYAPEGSLASQYIPERTLPLSALEASLEEKKSPLVGKAPEGILAGLTFVVTGDMETWPDRADLKTFIESSGGRLTGSISGKTDYLIANDQSSGTTKLQKARQLGVKIIDEEAFLKMAGLK